MTNQTQNSLLYKTLCWVLIALASFILSLLRLHFKIDLPIELCGIFFIAVIFDPWLASFTGLILGMLQGLFLDETYFYLLLLYIILGLYWGYMIRFGFARTWGVGREKLKRWLLFLVVFLLGSGFIELSIKTSLAELVFKEKGLIYYREGLVNFLQTYIYGGKFLALIFHGISWHHLIEAGLLIAVSYLIYKVLPAQNRYLLLSTQSRHEDILVEQNSVILYMLGFSGALFILFLIERGDSTNFRLLDLIHTASFWGIFFIVLGAITYFVGTKEKPHSYLKSLLVISLPPFLKIWMVTRIQHQISIRSYYQLKTLAETGGMSVEKINELINGQLYQQMWVTALFTVSYLLGSVIVILIIFKWNNELENQVKERSRKLEQAQAALIENEKLVSIGRLSAEVAHEINNPLYGVLNYSDILLSKVKQDRNLSNYVQTIRSGLYYISAILKQLGGISGQTLPSFGKVDVVKLIDHALFLMDYKFGSKQIKIVKEYSSESIIIEADAQLLQQVAINMIHNAIQAMQGAENFTVAISVGEKNIQISFKDEGVGIPADQLKNIFSPFFTTKKPEEGMGLGLTICEKIIKNHHGEIKVDSVVGKGTTFLITLPIQQNGD